MLSWQQPRWRRAALAGAGVQHDLAVELGGPHMEELGRLSSYLSYHPSGESELCGCLPTTGHQGNRELILPGQPRP